jgi:hypothetical protein
MKHDTNILTLKEFAAEIGKHPNTVIRFIFDKGLCKFLGGKGFGHYRIRREWADEYLKLTTQGGEAFGKSKL